MPDSRQGPLRELRRGRRMLRDRMPAVTFPLVGLSSRYDGPRWFSFWQDNVPADSIFHVDLGHGADLEPGPMAVTMTMPRVAHAGHSLSSLTLSALMMRGDLLDLDGLTEPVGAQRIDSWRELAHHVSDPSSAWRTGSVDVDGVTVATRHHTEVHASASYRVEVLELRDVFAAVYSRDLDLAAAGGLTIPVELTAYA